MTQAFDILVEIIHVQILPLGMLYHFYHPQLEMPTKACVENKNEKKKRGWISWERTIIYDICSYIWIVYVGLPPSNYIVVANKMTSNTHGLMEQYTRTLIIKKIYMRINYQKKHTSACVCNII